MMIKRRRDGSRAKNMKTTHHRQTTPLESTARRKVDVNSYDIRKDLRAVFWMVSACLALTIILLISVFLLDIRP